MRRLRALSAAELSFIFITCLLISNSIFAKDTVDPCKRQPFRGRCPVNDGRQTRSQFVLRYYVRKGECVSYPYGYCSNDQDEPRLFRFKEECEEACLRPAESTTADETTFPTTVTDGNAIGLLDVGHEATTSRVALNEEVEETTQQQETYGTNAPLRHNEYETPKTECQRQRERAGGLIKGAFVPECTPAGAFQPLQCEPDGQTCFCVNENGIEVANSRCQPGQPKPDCEKIIAAKPMRTNECTGGAESGPCQSSSQRWFYDEESAQCKSFTYSGCGGNGNNYGSEAACQRRCRPADDGAPKCVGGASPLSGSNGAPVNCSSTSCPAGYKCNVIQETHNICCPDAEKSPDAGVLDSGVSPSTPSVPASSFSRCAQPKDRGPCDRYELRFYYNSETYECKYFFYGGCEGNENNFKQVDDCEHACGRSSKPIGVTETTTSVETTHVDTTVAETTATLPPQTESTVITQFETELASTTGDLSSFPASTAFVSTFETQPQTEQTTAAETTTAPTTTAPTTTRAQPLVPEPTLPPQASPRTRPPTTAAPLLPANSCQHPLDRGHCGGQFVRWYWNAASRICETFTYSGCGGNGNNFNSRGECLGRCHKEVVKPVTLESVDLENVCDSDIDIGECGGTFMRYAFDRAAGECRQFKYGGCGGNGNNFATMDDCRLKCLHKKKGGASLAAAAASPQPLPKNICEHEIDIGECTGLFHRFAYDIKSNECRRFDYGGCGGNGNNFATIDDCRTACVKVKCAPEPECDSRRCQLVRDSHGCPFCSCPPVPRHPPVNLNANTRPPPSPIPAQPRAPCPAFDMDSCMEPCIVFRNRVNCNECVCPVIPTTSRPLADCAPFNVQACAAPCKVITNRAGCHECVCPVPPEILPETADADISMPDLPPLPAPTQRGRVAVAQPPAPAAAPAPAPAIGAFAAKINEAVEDIPPPSPIAFGELGEKCTQPLDPGPCTNFVQRWHFNPVRAECEPFQYGGCAGNRNHFFTQMECMVHCGRFLRNQGHGPQEVTEVPLTDILDGHKHQQEQRIEISPRASAPTLPPPPPPLQLQPMQRLETFTPSRDTISPLPVRPPQPAFVQPVALIVSQPQPQPTQPVFVPQATQTFTPSRDTIAPLPVRPPQPAFVQPVALIVSQPQPQPTQPVFVPQPTQTFTPSRDTIAPLPVRPPQPAFVQPVAPIVSQPQPQPTQPVFVPQPTLPSNPPVLRPVATTATPSVVQTDTTVVLTTKMKKMDMGVQLETKIRAPDGDETTTHKTPTLRIQPIVVVQPTENTASMTTTNTPITTSTTIAETTTTAEATTAEATTSTTPVTSPPTTSAPTTRRTTTMTEPVTPSTVHHSVAPPTQSPPTAEPIPPSLMVSSTVTTTTVALEIKPPSMAGIETKMPAFRPFSETEPLPPARELRPLPQAPPTESNALLVAPVDVEVRAFAQPNVAPETAAKALTPPPTPIPRKAQMEWLYPPGATISPPSPPPPAPPVAETAATPPRAAPLPQPAVQPLAALSEVKAIEIETATQPAKKEAKLSVAPADAKAYAPGLAAPPRIQIHQISFTSSNSAATIPVTVVSTETAQVTVTQPTTIAASMATNVESEPEEKPDQGIEGPIHRVQTISSIQEVTISTTATQPPQPQPQSQTTSRSAVEFTTTATVTTTTTAVPEIDDTCILVPEPGPCTDYVPRWFFNAQTAKCEQFSYGSCNGNKNNFVEREQCERRCRAEIDQFTAHLPVRCTRPRAEGQGVGYSPRWYYNQKNLRCEQFVYRGEGGNDNQFASVEDCERACKYFSSSHDGTASTPAGEPLFVAPNFAPRPILKENSGEDLTAPEHRKPSGNAANSAESQSFGARIATAEGNSVDVPQPAEPIETDTKPKYPQEPIAERPTNPDANLPPLGSSMKAHIDYGSGKRLGLEQDGPKAFGINIHTVHKEGETQAFGKANDANDKISPEEWISSAAPTFGDEWTAARIPVCPNGLNAMQYIDGRPVMCLPGKNQCPEKSVCYFNGLDYFCCPNEDDPYDKHVFGGYDGEEVKHGYKDVASPLSIHSIRRSRRAASGGAALPPISFLLDQVQNSLRFDDKPVQRIASASSLISSRRVSPCLEEARRGSCNEAHLRFFYDINTDRCRLFYYSGCGGNSNNFATETDCKRRCKIGTILTSNRDSLAAVKPVPAAGPIVPSGQCPGGEAPLGDPSPVLCGNRTDSIGCPAGYYCRTGPPDVCCPTIANDGDLDISQLLNGQVERGDVRRKPFVAGAGAVGHDDEHKNHDAQQPAKYSDDENGVIPNGPQPASAKNAALGVPANMCPDGSNALEESGVARKCGTGLDGHELCPRGYYCSIDPEQQARLCCPLSIQGSNIGSNLPAPGSIAPYFGIRGANPGEVIDRGSLPSDPKPPKLITPAPKQHPIDIHPADYEDERSIPATPASHLNLGVESSNAHSVAEVAPAVMPQANGSEYDHLIIKNNANRQAKVIEAHKPSADDRFDKELFSRGVGATSDDPFETLWERSRGSAAGAEAAARAATCRPRPSEGRTCQPGEPAPRSNLQFFYSEKERVCKVFFYRGCGGNANRFPTKRECEQYCTSQA